MLFLSSANSFQVQHFDSRWRDAGGVVHSVSAAVDGIKVANGRELRDKFHGASRQWFWVEWRTPSEGNYEIKLWSYNGNRGAVVPGNIQVNGVLGQRNRDIRGELDQISFRSFDIGAVNKEDVVRFTSISPATSGIFWFVEIELWKI